MVDQPRQALLDGGLPVLSEDDPQYNMAWLSAYLRGESDRDNKLSRAHCPYRSADWRAAWFMGFNSKD